MNKALLFGSAVMMIFGCASVDTRSPPAPVAAETPCRCRDCWLSVDLPPDWRAREILDCSRADFFHRTSGAYVGVMLLAAPDPGSPAAALAIFRRSLEGDGIEVFDVAIPEDDRQTVGLGFHDTRYGDNRWGRVICKISKTPGSIFTLIGTWPGRDTAGAEAAFDDLVRRADDLPPRE